MTGPADRDPPGASALARQRALFRAALARPAAERAGFLARECGSDPELLAGVRGLLAAHALGVSPLDVPIAGALGLVVPDERAPGNPLLEHLRRRAAPVARYSVGRQLARGGMGTIFLVRDLDLGRDLAMKVIRDPAAAAAPAEASGGSWLLRRFLAEAQVTGRLDHPGIVPVHDLGIDAAGRVFFTMKLVEGDTLGRVFDQVATGEDGWSTTRAVSVLLRVCEAMAFAHERGVIHRDLKPDNVMVGRHGEVYVMDWGLARVLGAGGPRDEAASAASAPAAAAPQTLHGEVFGSPRYMPPEQAAGRVEEIGPRSDVYSAGALLYRLLAGRDPYADADRPESSAEQVARVLAGPPRDLAEAAPSAPPELRAIAARAMARRIEDRYAGMGELAGDLRAYLEGRVVAAYASGAIAELKKWVQRNRAFAATAALFALALLGGGIGFAEHQRRAAERLAVESAKARVNAARAAEGEQAALAEKLRVLRVADLKRLSDLRARADALWPATPGNLDAMRVWLRDAEPLLSRMPEHVATLAALRARGRAAVHPKQAELDRLLAELAAGLGSAEGEAPGSRRLAQARAAALEVEIATTPAFEFADPEDAWWHESMTRLVAELAAFAARDPHAAAESVRRRIELVEALDRRLAAEDAPAWDAAIRSIAAVVECPRYGGLKLEPQFGLVPLGRDPESELWEFWLAETTGPRPERGGDGALRLADDFGLVLVLLPGGSFAMGAQKSDPSAVGFDPLAQADEAPVRTVELEPFFIAKYEMTQAQWRHATGAEPSYWNREDYPFLGSPLRLPVERVTWDECEHALLRLGLVLPTEAQWEYACRAGTLAPWSSGAEPESLRFVANLRDADAARIFGWDAQTCEDWSDAAGPPWPVGVAEQNAFGLHDMHGNVWEWTRDMYADYALPVALGNGARQSPDLRNRVNRGGAFAFTAEKARSALRDRDGPGLVRDDLGLRPARQLDR